MRHVDHPHHAEGDGQADRGEQQHRPKADPLVEAHAQLDQGKIVLNAVNRRLGSRPHLGHRLDEAAIGVLAQQLAEQRSDIGRDGVGQPRDRGQTNRRIVADQVDLGDGEFDRHGHSGMIFPI